MGHPSKHKRSFALRISKFVPRKLFRKGRLKNQLSSDFVDNGRDLHVNCIKKKIEHLKGKFRRKDDWRHLTNLLRQSSDCNFKVKKKALRRLNRFSNCKSHIFETYSGKCIIADALFHGYFDGIDSLFLSFHQFGTFEIQQFNFIHFGILGLKKQIKKRSLKIEDVKLMNFILKEIYSNHPSAFGTRDPVDFGPNSTPLLLLHEELRINDVEKSNLREVKNDLYDKAGGSPSEDPNISMQHDLEAKLITYEQSCGPFHDKNKKSNTAPFFNFLDKKSAEIKNFIITNSMKGNNPKLLRKNSTTPLIDAMSVDIFEENTTKILEKKFPWKDRICHLPLIDEFGGKHHTKSMGHLEDSSASYPMSKIDFQKITPWNLFHNLFSKTMISNLKNQIRDQFLLMYSLLIEYTPKLYLNRNAYCGQSFEEDEGQQSKSFLSSAKSSFHSKYQYDQQEHFPQQFILNDNQRRLSLSSLYSDMPMNIDRKYSVQRSWKRQWSLDSQRFTNKSNGLNFVINKENLFNEKYFNEFECLIEKSMCHALHSLDFFLPDIIQI